MKKNLLLLTAMIAFTIGFIFYGFTQEIKTTEPRQMTQGEFVVQLVKALGLDSGLMDSSTISDYIERLKANSIEPVEGFQPDKLITKEEKAFLISKALKLATKVVEQGEQKQYIRDKAVVIHLEGDVKVKCGDSLEWINAEKGMKLSEKDYIRTGSNSLVDLSVGIAGRVRIKENTELLLKTLSSRSDGKAETVCLYLAMGEMTVDVTKLSEDSLFLTTTPTTTVGVRGTIYNVKVAESKTEIK